MSAAPKQSFSATETSDLSAIAAIMIPASAVYAVPAADDAAIMADVVTSVGPDFEAVCAALAELSGLSGGSFAALEPARRTVVATRFLNGDSAPLATLARVILQCYYRDDRVMRSLGLEARPPFPQGHSLEQGDWSLLEPVRARAKMWRDAP